MVEGRVEDVLASHLPADLVILNPPRAGLDRKVPGMLGQGQARRVIYVSCDPATLARDLSRMGSRYRILGLRAFDLFPQTAHVETVVTLETTGG
jgi:23S rRNA (uracil1939-C5)-methyltransferase